MRLSRLIPTLLLLLLMCSQAVTAGPLRERLAQRMAEREQTGTLEDGSDGPSHAFTLPADGQLKRDIRYGSDPAQRLDVYLPAQASHAPVIVMVHGGGWRHGDKAMNRVVENKVQHWLPLGYVVVSINYRMLPQADPLVQVNDVASALALVQAQAASWGGDPTRVVMMGHSAGAHLVALLSTTPALAVSHKLQPWLGSVLLDGAAYDLTQTMQGRHMRLYDQAFGQDPAFWQQVSPLAQLSQKSVPLLGVCSTQRPDQPCRLTQALLDKATSLGSRTRVLPVALSHGEVNQQLGLPSAYTSAVDDFLKSLGLPG